MKNNMLRIENIEKIRGFKILIKGYTFVVTEISVEKDLYTITFMEDNGGTAWSPVVLTLCREPELFEQGRHKKYVIRQNGDNPKYISNYNYCTSYQFMSFVTEYLNNI